MAASLYSEARNLSKLPPYWIPVVMGGYCVQSVGPRPQGRLCLPCHGNALAHTPGQLGGWPRGVRRRLQQIDHGSSETALSCHGATLCRRGAYRHDLLLLCGQLRHQGHLQPLPG
jgi:hypothetical protein